MKSWDEEGQGIVDEGAEKSVEGLACSHRIEIETYVSLARAFRNLFQVDGAFFGSASCFGSSGIPFLKRG